MNAPAATQSLKLAVFQYSARDETPVQRLQRLDDILRGAKDAPFDLVVCPELFLSGYNVGRKLSDLSQTHQGSFAASAAGIARNHRTALVYGYPETADGHLYNSAIAIDSSGRQLANHRKLRIPNGFERDWFASGGNYTMLEIAGFSIALLICYEVEFPEAVRACASAGADLILAPTALRAEWSFVARQLIPTRAFENGAFLAYANYCGEENGFVYLGESCIIGPDGREIARAGADETLLAAVLKREEVARARERLPYLEHRDDLDRVAIDGCSAPRS
ncbi:MAG TPA: carbon-nitrogen hydrolase family protein [Dongiaceae bacterium]